LRCRPWVQAPVPQKTNKQNHRYSRRNNLPCDKVSILFYIFSNFIILLLFWGYTVTFIKVLTYISWIHPLHHSPLSPFPSLLE
jgi:hypothetical protein